MLSYRRMLLMFDRRFSKHRKVVWDVVAVAGSRLVRQGCLMIAMAIAARMLEKELLGVWALIYIVIQFGVLLSDSGISTFVVQNRDLTPRKYSTAFYLSTALAGVVAAIIAMVGLPISLAFGFGDYGWQFAAASATVVPMTMNGLLQAKLRRDRRFTAMLVSDSCASLSLLIGVIWMLPYGFQLWAFVVPTAVAALIGFTVCVIVCGFPRPAINRSDVKEITDYSLGLVGFSSVNFWARNLDHVLIGRFLGAAPLGIYSFAYRIMMLPLSQINATAHTVSLPYLSPHQDDPAKLRDAMRKIITIVAMMVTLPMIWIWIEREYIVELVLGSQWSKVGELLVVLAPLAILQALINPTGLCFQVRGRTKLLFYIGMINTTVTVIGFAVGVWLGSLMWVVICYAAANLIMVPFTVGMAMQTIEARFGNWLRWCGPFLLLLPLCYLTAAMVPEVSSRPLHLMVTCLSTGVVGIVIYAWVGLRVFTNQSSSVVKERLSLFGYSASLNRIKQALTVSSKDASR